MGLIEFYLANAKGKPVAWSKLHPRDREKWVKKFDQYIASR